MTCYVPSYTRELGRKRQSLCGRYVDPKREHSNEPSCQECQEALAELNAETRTADELIGERDPITGHDWPARS